MKTENKENRGASPLDKLDAEKRDYIVELATKAHLRDIAKALKEHGIETSAPSLSRFLRREQERKMLDERADSRPTVEVLAEDAKDGKLREGTLEAVRQRLYDRALLSNSPEEARQLYAAMVKEETKLKELELERRRIAISEEELKLKALTARAQLAGKVRAEVVEDAENAQATEAPEVKQLAAPSEKEQRLAAAVEEAVKILNRGGEVSERFVAVRALLTETMKTVP